MALGTFTLVIDGQRIGAGDETTAELVLKVQGRSTLVDADANEFHFPHASAAAGMSIGLPYTVQLPTNVASGAGANSTQIGYSVTVTTRYGGRVHADFAARPAGATVHLTDVTDELVTPVSDLTVYRDQAETAAGLAEGFAGDAEDAAVLADASADASAGSATAAAGSASAASTSATAAQTARTGAETARTGAETARTQAQASATAAASSATDAAASAGAASGAAASTDTVMAARINDPASATRAGLTNAIVDALPFINVKDHGALGDGTTDDTAAIQAALDSVPDAGGHVHFPAGTYLVPAGGLTCDERVKITGEGMGVSLVHMTALTGTLLTLAAPWSVVEDIGLTHPLGATRDANLTGLYCSARDFTHLHRVQVSGFLKGARVLNGIYFTIDGCSFRDFHTAGLELSYASAGDAGDSTVSNCTFDRTGAETLTGGTGLLWTSGGGLRLSNNKFNSPPGTARVFENPVRFHLADGVFTGVLMVEGNSIEGFSGKGVSLERAGAGAVNNSVIIVGNEISGYYDASTQTGIYLDDDTNGVVIDGNHIYNVDRGIYLNRVKHAALGAGNVISRARSTGVEIRSLSQNVNLGRFPIDCDTNGLAVKVENFLITPKEYVFDVPLRNVADATERVVAEIDINSYASCLAEVEAIGTAQGSGSGVARASRELNGQGAGAAVYIPGAAVGPADKTTTGHSIQFNSAGLAGKVQITVKKNAGTSLDCLVRVRVAGMWTSVKQVLRNT